MMKKTVFAVVLGRIAACAVTLRWRVGVKRVAKPAWRGRLEQEERRQRPEEARN